MNINCNFPINSLGYGVAGLNILKALDSLGHNCTLFPINLEVANQNDVTVLQKALDRQIKYDPKAPCIRIWHQHALAETIGGGQRIGFPIFELDTFTKFEQHQLRSLDKIFVCSEWAREIVAQNQITTPTYVVPLGVDRSIFNENVLVPEELVNFFNVNNKTLIFLHMGKWEIRKGADFVIECFNQAFEPDDNVHLIMACHNPFPDKNGKEVNSGWERMCKNSKMGHKITCPPRLKTQQDVASLMQLADVGFFPARAEGWNLELLEMMALGKDTICTDYSGHTEFVNSKNSLLIKIDELEDAFDGIWFHKQGKWGVLGDKQREQAIFHLRELYKNWNIEEDRKPNDVVIETSKRFSWKNSAEKTIIGLEA